MCLEVHLKVCCVARWTDQAWCLQCGVCFVCCHGEEQVAAADIATNMSDGRSVDCVHIVFGRHLFESRLLLSRSEQKGERVLRSTSRINQIVYFSHCCIAKSRC